MKHYIPLHKRLDVIVKYLFVQAYIEKADFTFYKELYRKHIMLQSGGIEDHKNSIDSFERSFKELIRSIQKYGFDPKNPIIINSHGDILNGAHRFACCLYLKIEPMFQINDTQVGIDWSYKWFQKKDFLQSELLEILGCYMKLQTNRSIIICWPNIREKNFCKYATVLAHIRIDFESSEAFKEIIYDIYSYDTGIYTGIGVQEKINHLASVAQYIDVYVLDISPEILYKHKEEIRAGLIPQSGISDMSKAKYYTIHSGDTSGETLYISQILFSKNNIQYLQLRNIRNRGIFYKRLEQLETYCKKNNIGKNSICIVGSAPLEIFDLHDSSDIDFIKEFSSKTGIIKIHKDIDYLDYEYSSKYSNTTVIKNQNYHFLFRGFKLISLNLLAEIKYTGTRSKDIEHSQLISNFLNNNHNRRKTSFYRKLILYLKYQKQRSLITGLRFAIYITKKLHIYTWVSYIWRRYILKRNWD